MMTIYKYPIVLKDRQEVLLPVGAAILTVQMQERQINLWATVDTDAALETRTILLFETGEPIVIYYPHHIFYLGTVQTYDGQRVWHIFEETQKR